MQEKTNPCKGCIHYEVPLHTNPEGQSCKELDTVNKCSFFVAKDRLSPRGLKITDAIMSGKTDLVELSLLLEAARTTFKDRSRKLVSDINIGDYVTFMRGEVMFRERVGLLNVEASEAYVAVGTELDPIRVPASKILNVEPGNSKFTPFRIFTAKQRDRLNKLSLLNTEAAQLKSHRESPTASGSVTVYRPGDYTVLSSALGGKSLSKAQTSLMPHFTNQEKWIREHIYGERPEAPRYRRPKFAVYCNDLPHAFFVKHGFDSYPNYADLNHPFAGAHDFVLFTPTKKEAESLLLSMISKYHGDGWPKDGAKRFTILSRRAAFKMAYGEYEGRFSNKFFRFAMCSPVSLDPNEGYEWVEGTTKSGKVKAGWVLKTVGRLSGPYKGRIISKKESLRYEPS